MASALSTALSSGRLSSELLDRLPPQNLEAEKGVLGALLLDPQLCDEVTLIVRAEDFYSDVNQRLFNHLITMHNDQRRIDTMLLRERLHQAGDYEFVGGATYLAELVDSVQVTAHAAHYATIVRQKATLRNLIHAGTEIMRDAFDASQDPKEVLSRAEERLFTLLEQQGGVEAQKLEGLIQEVWDRIDARMDQAHDMRGVPTGFVDLDDLIGGLRGGELIILAARPSMGKTALATNIAEHASLEAQIPTLFVSLEMSRIELGERMLASFAKVDGHKIRRGRLSETEQKRLVDQGAELAKARLFVDDTPNRTVTEISATARRMKRSGGLGLVVIDYLQMIEPDNSRDPREAQVSRIARRLKGLARELHVPVLCLAQLNRQAEATKDNLPRLSHLRESGAIEQDADLVMFVHREDYAMAKEEAEQQGILGKAEVIVAKNRNGPTGKAALTWLASFTRFASAPRYEQQANEF